MCACQFMGSPVIADVSGDGKPDVVAVSEDGGLNAWDRAGNAVIRDLHAPPRPGKKDWQYESYMFFNSPVVTDLDGDGDNEIVLAVGDLRIEPAARQGLDRADARTWQRSVADVQAAGEAELVQVMLAS